MKKIKFLIGTALTLISISTMAFTEGPTGCAASTTCEGKDPISCIGDVICTAVNNNSVKCDDNDPINCDDDIILVPT